VHLEELLHVGISWVGWMGWMGWMEEYSLEPQGWTVQMSWFSVAPAVLPRTRPDRTQ
jgi:hypothetical protein